MTSPDPSTDTVPGPESGRVELTTATEEIVALALKAREVADAAHERLDTARRSTWRTGFVAALVALVVVSPVGVVVFEAIAANSASDAARQVEIDREAGATADLARAASTAAAAANEELARLGRAQVPVSTPGQAPAAQVLVEAATAQVIASLAREGTDRDVTAIAREIARQVAALPAPPGPDPAELGRAVAAALAANPPPAGTDGDDGVDGQPGVPGPTGPPGPPPSAEAIQAALRDLIAADPSVLCPAGGAYRTVRVITASGGTADIAGCVLDQQSPPESELPAPDPTTPPSPDPGDGDEGGGLLDPLLPG